MEAFSQNTKPLVHRTLLRCIRVICVLAAPASLSLFTDSPPNFSGLFGLYDGSSWDAARRLWRDRTATSNPTTQTRGTGTAVLPNFLNGRSVLAGSTADSLQFDSARLTNNPNYSLFFVSRYNDSASADGPTGNCNRMMGEPAAGVASGQRCTVHLATPV